MPKKLTYDELKEYIESKGYKLLSGLYNNVHQKILIKCPLGHEYKVHFNNFVQGSRCPLCCRCRESTSSKGEKEVLKYICSLTDTTVVPNDRTHIINPKTNQYLELDIFLPKIMKAIEYNGAFWHSSEKVIWKDMQKVLQCEKLGIDLLVVHEDNWIDYKDIVKKMIKNWIVKIPIEM